jgi:cytochrome c556
MNDEFLYRIRTEPPASFARALKDRLDHTSRHRAKFASFGFGLFLFGTAFAMMSPALRERVAAWFAADADRREVAQLVAAPMPEHMPPALPPETLAAAPSAPSPDAPPVDGEFPPDRVRAEDVPASRGTTPDLERPTPEQRAARLMELFEEVEKHLGAEATESLTSSPGASDPSYEELQSSPSEFIVTGPLLAEPGTAAHAFQQRRALFAVMAWTAEPVHALLKKQSRFGDPQKHEVSGKRLEQLARMIPDAFAYDSRKSDVPTRTLDRVWEDPALFARRVQEMQLAGRLLANAAAQGHEMGVRQAAYRVAFACMRCHEDFRENANNDVGALYP